MPARRVNDRWRRRQTLRAQLLVVDFQEGSDPILGLTHSAVGKAAAELAGGPRDGSIEVLREGVDDVRA